MPSTSIARFSRSLAGQRIPLRASTVNYATNRSLSVTALRAAEKNPHPKREAMKDREKIEPSADEYAQSGSDSTAAANESAAFSRTSDPQEAKKEAGKGNEVNPLDASPANPNLGTPTREVEGGSKEKSQ